MLDYYLLGPVRLMTFSTPRANPFKPSMSTCAAAGVAAARCAIRAREMP